MLLIVSFPSRFQQYSENEDCCQYTSNSRRNIWRTLQSLTNCRHLWKYRCCWNIVNYLSDPLLLHLHWFVKEGTSRLVIDIKYYSQLFYQNKLFHFESLTQIKWNWTLLFSLLSNQSSRDSTIVMMVTAFFFFLILLGCGILYPPRPYILALGKSLHLSAWGTLTNTVS